MAGNQVRLPFGDNVDSFEISSDNRIVVVGEDGQVSVWNMAGNQVRLPFAHDVFSIKLSPDNRIIVETKDDRLSVWKMEGEQIVEPFANNIGPFEVSSDGYIVVQNLGANRLSIWRIVKGAGGIGELLRLKKRRVEQGIEEWSHKEEEEKKEE